MPFSKMATGADALAARLGVAGGRGLVRGPEDAETLSCCGRSAACEPGAEAGAARRCRVSSLCDPAGRRRRRHSCARVRPRADRRSRASGRRMPRKLLLLPPLSACSALRVPRARPAASPAMNAARTGYRVFSANSTAACTELAKRITE